MLKELLFFLNHHAGHRHNLIFHFIFLTNSTLFARVLIRFNYHLFTVKEKIVRKPACWRMLNPSKINSCPTVGLTWIIDELILYRRSV